MSKCDDSNCILEVSAQCFHLLAAAIMTSKLLLTTLQLHSMHHKLINKGGSLLAGLLAAVSTD